MCITSKFKIRFPTTCGFLLRFFLLCLALQTSGCVMMAVEALKTTYPTYGEVTKQWAAIAPNHGRVVIYLPAQSLGDAVKDSVFVHAIVQVDGGRRMQLMTGTFFFGDLPAGQHEIQVLYQPLKNPALGGFSAVECKIAQAVQIDVREGSTTYLRTIFKAPTIFAWGDAPEYHAIAEVPSNIAAQELSGLHHNYKNPQPFDAPKEIQGATWGDMPLCQ